MRSTMKTAIILSMLALMCNIDTNAQNTIEGRVTDKETRQPLESATVIIQHTADATVINYTLTDTDGRFRLTVSSPQSVKLGVLYMGYKKVLLPIDPTHPMEIALEPETILLKEVQIRPGRIWGRQDTLKYDLTRFTSSQDRNVGDVLKKLPGINVEENGTIKYNGKEISNFYVEGMDVSGGRYNQINNNLKADAVQSAEVIEGHQPIKSLRGKTFTDDVALNLKLKPEARSQWIYTANGSGGYGEEVLYDASLSALQLNRKQQTIYNYKTNNTGRDMQSEQEVLAAGNSFDRITDDGAPSFLPLPGITMPLSRQRLLFNDTHTTSANRLYRLTEDKQLRLLFNYTHDRTTQQQGSDETYYFAQDTVRTLHNQNYRLLTDCLNGELNYENNADNRYTRENFSFTGDWQNGLSAISGDKSVTQQIKHSGLDMKNYFSQLHTQDKYTWGIRSFFRYSYLPSSLKLTFDDDRQSSTPLREYQEMNVSNAYTDNSLYWMRKKNGVNYQLTGGFRGELSSVTGPYSANRYMFYATPHLEWNRENILLTAALSAQWSHLPEQSCHYLFLNPSVFFRYTLTPRWKMYLSGNITRSTGRLDEIYPVSYRRNYRTIITNPGNVPENTRQLYSFYLEYKNAVKEFFWTASFAYLHTDHNLMTRSDYKDGIFYLSPYKKSNSDENYTLHSVLSKGVYDWNLKSSVELTMSRTKGKQCNDGVVQDYRYDYLSVEPKIIWAPSRLFEAAYQAKLSCGSSKIGNDRQLDALWNLSQRLILSIGWGDTDLRLSGEHFYNDIDRTKHLNTWLADASLVQRVGKWCFTASVTNLLNKKEYSYTLYSAVQSSTSWIKLRPREYLLSIQYQW